MRLASLKYSEFIGHPQEWSLDTVILGSKNLIVGRNSTGKTRALNVIAGIAKFLSGMLSVPVSGTYLVEWVDFSGRTYIYKTEFHDSAVTQESLHIDGKMVLDRGLGGFGRIWAEKIENGVMIEFQAPTNELAITKKRDAVQHGFIEPLYQWAAAVRHYLFGSPFGKDHLMILIPNAPAVDDRDGNQVVGVFRAGDKEFGERFTDALILDMQSVGYDLVEIRTGLPFGIRFQGAPGEVSSLVVKERDLSGFVDQINMSQGM